MNYTNKTIITYQVTMFIGKIAHISDIHIKTIPIDFSSLYESLRQQQPDIIVLTGDIIHTIFNITPNIIIDVISFLTTLINIAPVVMIPGNHDINCKLNDIDFFTAITYDHKLLVPPRFNYWRHSGTYTFYDIDWTVVLYNEPVPEYIFSINTQILLFHEFLDRLTPDIFNQYTVAMGGHVHTRKIVYPNVAYAGSLYQQNIKESHLHHGYLLWRFNQNSTIDIVEIDIETIIGYLAVQITDNKDCTELPIPKQVYYYDILIDNSDNAIVSDIINNYKVLYSKLPKKIINKNSTVNHIDMIDQSITSIDLHISLIKQYTNNSVYTDDIIQLHKEYYSSYSLECNKFRVKLVSLEFENLYNFQGKNFIDFTQMKHKLSGIIAKNNTGKTAIIDIILFALYDIYPRVSTKKDIINNSSNDYYVKLNFEVNNTSGTIIKQKNIVQFFYNNEDMTQKTIPKTLNEIKLVIGNYLHTFFTNFQLQYKNTNFINSSAIIRRQKLISLLSLDFFTDIEDNVVKTLSELNVKYQNIMPMSKDNRKRINDRIKDIINGHIQPVDLEELEKELLTYPTVIVRSLQDKLKQYGISYLFKICKNIDDNSSDSTYIIIKQVSFIMIQIEHYKLYNQDTLIDYNSIYDELFYLCKNTVQMEEYHKILHRQHILKLYRQVIKPSDGIINLFLSKYKTSMELEINELLTNIGITIKIDEDFEIYYTTDNQNWFNSDIASGYQKFILNIVFMLYLWKIANVTLPDILIIDEGFGTCDHESIEIVTKFLLNIVHTPEFPSIIFIVSHIDYLNQHIEYPLYIINNSIGKSKHVYFTDTTIVDHTVDHTVDQQAVHTVDHSVDHTVDHSVDQQVVHTVDQQAVHNVEITNEKSNSEYFHCDICDKKIKYANKQKHLSSKTHNKLLKI